MDAEKTPTAEADANRWALTGAYSEDGVYLTLIRCMLELSPAERLEYAEKAIKSMLDLVYGSKTSGPAVP